MTETATPRTPSTRFLITGGAGFIGHRTAAILLAADPGVKVAILDNLSVGMPMPSSTGRLTPFEGDIRDRVRVEQVMAEFRPDTIIHLAAVHHIPTCEKKRAYALDVNVVGTETLLEFAELQGINRFVLASSGAVYDWRPEALQETNPLAPCDNYSLAKLTNERQLAYWVERTGGSARIARIFNTIGHDDPNGHLVPDIIGQIPAGVTKVEIALGNLTPRRDYIHADDTARGIATLARHCDLPGVDVFNVASGKDVSVGELVILLGEVMGIDISVREDAARKRRVDRPSQLAATGKIEQQLGFMHSKSLRIALEDIVRHSGRPVVRQS
jgi:nucleoside-diphosphate-sugar epimerase